jgi:hypothetical protein
MSSVTSVRDALEGYAGGRLSAEQLVGVLAAAYYRDGGRGKGGGLNVLMEVIERAHPGIVELSASPNGPGFEVRLAARPFPRKHEGELRQTVQAILAGSGHVDQPRPGFFVRVLRAVRNIFRS